VQIYNYLKIKTNLCVSKTEATPRGT